MLASLRPRRIMHACVFYICLLLTCSGVVAKGSLATQVQQGHPHRLGDAVVVSIGDIG